MHRTARNPRSGVLLVAVAAALTVSCGAATLRLPPGLAATPVAFPSPSGSIIHGWLTPGRPGTGAVLLLHGVGASRLEMLGRTRFLAGAGYSVLSIDFRAHGESTGGATTYGGLESRDARAALAFLRAALPGERVGVIGISMGGAAALLGSTPLPVDALVLESVYPTIVDAVRDRARAWLGPAGPLLVPLAMRWLFPREGVSASELRPIDHIGDQRAPVFVLAGTADPYTTAAESLALFARARAPKDLWMVERAGHVDLHAFARSEYERRVGAFLARHLRAGAVQGGMRAASP